MLHRCPVSVQADETVVGVLGGMLHKQNLEPFGQFMILAAGSEVIDPLQDLIEGMFI